MVAACWDRPGGQAGRPGREARPGGQAGRPVLPGPSDGLCDRAVGFNDSGRNVLIPRGIVGIYSMDLL